LPHWETLQLRRPRPGPPNVSHRLPELYRCKVFTVRVVDWHIVLSPWIIQDGNYGDFHRGDTAEFALEYYPQSLVLSDNRQVHASRIDDSRYRVTAEVVYSESDFTVLDFGLRAYSRGRDTRPASTRIEGELTLGIDPFFYFESIGKNPRVPPLVYTWRIDRIVRTSAPLISGKGPRGPKHLVWDKSRKVSEDVDRTDAWGDDRKMRATPNSLPMSDFSYTLVCTKLDEPPASSKRRRP